MSLTEKSRDGNNRFTPKVKQSKLSQIHELLKGKSHKDCYVHFMEKNTENLFRSRVEHTGKVQ
jgi:hypothetical protein